MHVAVGRSLTATFTAFRDKTLALCGAAGHTQMDMHIWTLTQVLRFEPEETSVHFLVRRGVAFYRLRKLQEAHDDLSQAIEVSYKMTRIRDLDALRYRALVRQVCNNSDGAKQDVDEVLARKKDPLAYAIRALLRASDGSVPKAIDDLEKIERNMAKADDWQSQIAAANLDLLYLSQGWAQAAVRSLLAIYKKLLWFSWQN